MSFFVYTCVTCYKPKCANIIDNIFADDSYLSVQRKTGSIIKLPDKMNEITKRKALKIMIGLLTLVIIFHLAIITQIIPYHIVWAGKLNSVNEMYAFEAASLSINIFIIASLLLKGKHMKQGTSNKVLNTILWLFVVLFALNTIGNLMAQSQFERLVFTPLTLMSSILIWIIVRKDRKPKPAAGI